MTDDELISLYQMRDEAAIEQTALQYGYAFRPSEYSPEECYRFKV